MQVVLYFHKDRSLEGHCSFVSSNEESEQAITIDVPDGSSFTGTGAFTCLQTPDGKTHSAARVLVYCKIGVDGYAVVPTVQK